MQVFYLLFVLCGVFLVSGESEHDIQKRSFYLLFPRNGVFQFTYGLTVPFVLPRRSINLTWGLQSQYNLPNNISDFYPNTIDVRSSPFSYDIPRIKFYEYLANLLNNFGLNGEQCLLRSVCEIAEVPMYQREDSVLEKIVQFLFTPSFELKTNQTSRAVSDKKVRRLTEKLLKAENFGKLEGSCDDKYSKCIISIVDLMTVLYVI